MPKAVPPLKAAGLVLVCAILILVLISRLAIGSGGLSLSGMGAVLVVAIETLAFFVPPVIATVAYQADPTEVFRLHWPSAWFALPVALAAPALSAALFYIQEVWATLWGTI